MVTVISGFVFGYRARIYFHGRGRVGTLREHTR